MDIHDKLILIKKNIGGKYVRADIARMPFKNISCMFVISVLEHLKNTRHILNELKRCLIPNGTIIFGIPSSNFFVKLWFKIKKSPALKTHKKSKNEIINEIKKQFSIIEIKQLNIGPINLYTVVKCTKNK
jgi:ubiquinone/menaquinone biosynthesis C-methylase UbiE